MHIYDAVQLSFFSFALAPFTHRYFGHSTLLHYLPVQVDCRLCFKVENLEHFLKTLLFTEETSTNFLTKFSTTIISTYTNTGLWWNNKRAMNLNPVPNYHHQMDLVWQAKRVETALYSNINSHLNYRYTLNRGYQIINTWYSSRISSHFWPKCFNHFWIRIVIANK